MNPFDFVVLMNKIAKKNRDTFAVKFLVDERKRTWEVLVEETADGHCLEGCSNMANSVNAICGHPTSAIGAPYSNARFECEGSPCVPCAEVIHCEQHQKFIYECHWCHVRLNAVLKMTDAEKCHHYRLGRRPVDA